MLCICFIEEIFLSKSILPAIPKGLTLFLLARLCCCRLCKVESQRQMNSTESSSAYLSGRTKCAAVSPLHTRSISAKLSCWGSDLSGPFTFAAQKTALVKKTCLFLNFISSFEHTHQRTGPMYAKGRMGVRGVGGV